MLRPLLRVSDALQSPLSVASDQQGQHRWAPSRGPSWLRRRGDQSSPAASRALLCTAHV